MNNHYTTLGVKMDASTEDVKSAYRARIRSYHPDLFGSAPAELQEAANAIAAELNEAYRVLSNPAERMHYDDTLGMLAQMRVSRGAGPFTPADFPAADAPRAKPSKPSKPSTPHADFFDSGRMSEVSAPGFKPSRFEWIRPEVPVESVFDQYL